MVTEDDILAQDGLFDVRIDREGGKTHYAVCRFAVTHAIVDSYYSYDEDGLSLAMARFDYLRKRGQNRNLQQKVA